MTQHPKESSSKQAIHAQTKQLIAQHFDVLMAHADDILNTPNWRHIHLHGLKVGLMYFGGCSTVQLGGLLSAWQEGLFMKQTEEGDFYAISGGGSPLSGRHDFAGFYKGEKRVFEHSSLVGSVGGFVGPVISKFKEHNLHASPWSLTQLLNQLGVPLPDEKIWGNAEVLGLYNYKNATLKWKGESHSFPLQREDALRHFQQNRHVSDDWGPPVQNGKVILGDLQTMQFGVWKGERWEVQHGEGAWSLCPGHLLGPDGSLSCHWNGDLPPLVQEWMVLQGHPDKKKEPVACS